MIRSLRSYFGDEQTQITDNIASLFDRLRGVSLTVSKTSTSQSLAAPPSETLAAMLDKIRDLIPTVKESGVLSTPWAAAMLRRDEVRTASVLSWFLSPRGNHGCGDGLLREVLAHIRRELGGNFPTSPSQHCFVSVEECPTGDSSSRIDIQIDDPEYFLVIEVKIDAPEQDDQIDRYCEVAKFRTGGIRPWCVVFLTIDGRAPKTGNDARVVAMSWPQIAASLRTATRKCKPIPHLLATSFADHIRNL